MAASFQQLKDCDKKTINIVNGYIHQVQKLFPWQDNSYFIIPPLINHLCLSFYWIKFEFNKKYVGKNLEFIDRKTVTKTVEDNCQPLCFIGGSVSGEMCDIFRIEYLLKDYNKEYCPYIGYAKLKLIDKSCGVDFNAGPGFDVNGKHTVGIAIFSGTNKELTFYGSQYSYESFSLQEAVKKGDKFILEFDFVKSECYVYHNDYKLNEVILKLNHSHVIPLLSLFFQDEVMEITGYEFTKKK